jgi:hypothetical protein
MSKTNEVLESAFMRGIESTGLSEDVFKDKYSAKLKALKDAGTKPFNLSIAGKASVLSIEEMAVNQVIACEKAVSKGDTEILFHLQSQDDARLTKNNKAFSNLHVIVPVGNNIDLFHTEKQIDGCVKIRATYWSNKAFRPGFYRGRISKSIRDGYINYTINDIGATERTFKVPDIASGVPFRILAAYGPKKVTRNVKGEDGEPLRDENKKLLKEVVYKKSKDGLLTNDPLLTRSFVVLILNADGTTSTKSVSTIFDEWMDLKVDPQTTYKGIFRENGPYWNLNSKPVTSNEKIPLDESLTCDVVADLTGIRSYNGNFVRLQPMFGDAPIEVKQNPEKGTKIGYTTVSDMASNSINIIGDVSVFDPVTGPKGTLAGIVQIIGMVFINKERDTPGIKAYLIRDISSGMPAEPIKINEGSTPEAVTAEDAW